MPSRTTLSPAPTHVGRIKLVTTKRPLPKSKAANRVLIRQGIDIALCYFNYGSRSEIPALTAKARLWANKYFGGYRYSTKRAIGLLQAFPDLFNLDIDAPFRLCPTTKMSSPPAHPEAEGNTLRDHQRAVRKTSSEPFPQFSEPLLASEEEIDEILDFRPRNPRPEGKPKPIMRVDANMLRNSGLLSTLPEFLGQLARSNLELETELANKPEGAGFELNDETPDDQPHIEMDVYAGLVETQKRRHARRVVIPSSGIDLRDELVESSSRKLNDAATVADTTAEDDGGNSSGYDTDASTSTTASLRVNVKKRKNHPEEAEAPPSKIRLMYQHPASELVRFDMATRRMVSQANPAITTSDPFAAMTKKRRAAEAAAASNTAAVPAAAPSVPSSPTGSAVSTGTTSSSSSEGTTRIIKIRVPENMRSKTNSPASSREASPAVASASPTRVLVIRSPNGGQDVRRNIPSSPPSRPVSPPAKKTPTRIVVVKRKSEEPEEDRPTKRARPSIEEL